MTESETYRVLTAYYGIRLVTGQTRWWHEETDADPSKLFCVHGKALDQKCDDCLGQSTKG